MPDLCLLLESVCTARDFLLEVGGEEERSLPQFMVNIIMNIMISSQLLNLGKTPTIHWRRQ